MEVIDVVYKHNLLEHSTTAQIQLHQGTDTTDRLRRLYEIGQIVRVPNLPITETLQHRATLTG